MFAFNLTGEIDEMRRRHDLVESSRRHMRDGEPEFGRGRRHDRARASRALADPCAPERLGLSSRHPALGWSYVAWQKIWRLAGVDHMHVNGLANKFSEPDESVVASARACLTPMFDAKPCTGDAGVFFRPIGAAGGRERSQRSARQI